jgi:hypothetical protein
MVIGTSFLRVDDPSLFIVVALVILAGGGIAYIDELRARRKPRGQDEHPRRAA